MSYIQIFLPLIIVLSLSTSTFAKTPLAQLAERSIESESDAVIIFHNQKEIFRYLPEGEDQLIETMSMTKSFASLAIGFLVDEKKISSIDEPLVKWFPEWKNSPKAIITLRHILTHTSGLEANRDAGDIYEQKDVIKYALEATLKDEPGSVHFYNNKAVNLIAGIVKKSSGKSVDQYLKEKLFDPLKIKKFEWRKDSVGNPICMAGLRMNAVDLIKIGQLLLDDGVWNGHRLLSQKWIKESMTPSTLNENYGLLWWLNYSSWNTKVRGEELSVYKQAGLPKIFLDALSKSQSKSDFNFNQFRKNRNDLASAFEKFDQLYSEKKIPYPHQVPVGPPIGFSAQGSAGQKLVILFKSRIIGVRQRIKRNLDDEGNEKIKLDDFAKLLMAL